ncbi:MAG TPA: hypothetical protein VFT68_16995 [Lapillicoccus sp.]|nr:hypothetical protein [Lapillicoccus sp.]
MSTLTVPSSPSVTRTRRHRRSLVAIESTMAVAGLGGGIMLVSGYGTPPVEALAPLGLSSWVLPGVWLTASVAVPSALAAALAWRGSPWTPRAVMVASALLGVELLVQIPFLGVNGLQAAMALVGGTAATLAWRARQTW